MSLPSDSGAKVDTLAAVCPGRPRPTHRCAIAWHPRVLRSPRRLLQRLLTLLVILGCLLQPVAPAAAYRAQPAAGPRAGPSLSDEGPGEAGGAARGRDSQATAAAASASSGAGSVPGIRAYVQSDVDCDFPQYSEVSPSWAEGAYAGGLHGKTFYICSEDTTVYVSLYAQAQGYQAGQGQYALVELTCLSGDCANYIPIQPDNYSWQAQYYPSCQYHRSRFQGGVSLPRGKYRMRVEAFSGLDFPPFCGMSGYYSLSMSLSLMPVGSDRCYAKEGKCLAVSEEVQPTKADPVNTRTGNFTHQEADFSIPTRGLPLEFERSYNSLDTVVGPLGRGWTHSYNMRLITATHTVTLVAPRGSRLPFFKKADGTLVPGPGVRATLVKNGDGSYTLTQGDQVVYSFDAGGHLVSLDDGQGNTTTLSYSGNDLTAISAPDGRALTLGYAAGRITQISDPLSRTVHYSYTADSLTGAVDPLGHTWSYGYDAQGRMTSFSDPQGHSVSNQFDGQGRVIVQRDKLNQPSYFAYSAERTVFTDTRDIPITHTYNTLGVLVSVTDALGHSTQYEHDHNYNVVRVTDPLSRTTRHTWSDCGCTIASVEDPVGHLTRMEYDGHNNLLSETDALTRTTRYAYDAQDNLVAITNTLGYTSTFSYDAYGQMVASTDANGHHSEYAHDPYGNLALITDTLGQATDMGYDLAGQLSSVTDANQHTTTFEYDAGGRLITTTGALSGQTIRDYDAVGRLTQVTDTNGKPTSYEYDAAGRLITVTNALEGRTVSGYDAGGNLTRLTDPRGKATLFGYDALDRTVAITDTLGHATWFGYDAVGNRTTVQDPTDVLIRYSYDDLNRPEETSGPLGLLSSYGYDPLGNLTRVTDANGHVTRYSYDPLDRLETVLDALDGLTVYDYDPLGNLRTATDAREHTTTYDYDAANRLKTVSDPLSHVTAYGYDAVGNTTVITDADQLVTYLTYDALDRLAQVQYADTAVSYAYDGVGNRLAMTDTTGTSGYAYDSLYRPLTITAPYAGPVGYRYDPAGNRIQTLYPTGELVTYGYDDANRLERVWDWASGVTTYTYDDAGRVLVALLANGVASDYEYDAAGRLVAIEHRRGEDWLTRFDYQLDLEGNRVALTETTTALTEYALPALGRPGGGGAGGWGSALPVGETIRYGYDAADRLRDASYANGDRYQYGYDAVGNRLAYSVTTQALLTGTTTYAYDDADRLTYVDATPISYDHRGNQLTDGVWTYTYNAAGRMLRAESITATHVYTYNGDGLLVAQNLDGVETAFTWDQALALPQVLATSNGLRGLYGLERLGVVVGGAWYYPQHDAIGSVRQWTDALGAVVGLQGYAPFGEALVPLGPPVAPWGFTGEWQDPAGLVYLRARWYHVALGRFTQVDLQPGALAVPWSRHAFAYASSNPLRYTDPSGRYLFEQNPDDPFFAFRRGEFPPMRSWTVVSRPNIEILLLETMRGDAVAEFTLQLRRLNAAAEEAAGTPEATALKAEAYSAWYDLVAQGCPLDYKGRIRGTFGERVRVGQRWFAYDIFANINYGYVGRAAGFSALELRAGAGVAQVIDNVLKPIRKGEKPRWEKVGPPGRFLDDPRDQAAIQIGMDIYEDYGLDVTPQQFYRAFYRLAMQLY